MARMSYAEAVIDALYRAMAEDEAVCLIGSHVLGLGPQRGLVDRLREGFPGRVLDPPTAEEASASIGIGAAMAGARPFVDIGTASFIFQAWPQIVNEAPNVYYMSGGQVTAPVIFHALVGIRLGGAAQHSARPQAMLLQAAGLQVVAPATSADVKPLLQGVIESERPTFWIDHVLLAEEEWDDSVPVAPFGKASVLREGKDVTIVGYSIDLVRCLKAADVLAKDGIDAEVIDLRTLAPMDHETVLASVAKTGRLVVSDECSPACSIASEISAFVAEEGFGTLTKPMKRVQFENVPVPISPPLEEFLMPTVEKVVAAAKELVG